MKILFLIFHGFDEANGISKKIRYQVKALRECGADVRVCYYDIMPDGRKIWFVNGEIIADFGKGTWGKMKKRLCFKPITSYALREKIDFVYIRSFHNANPFTIHLIKQLKAMGARVIMEIPTYPYDQEYVTPSMKVYLTIDRHFRHKLARELDAIITFSDKEKIFGVPTIRISNGIDFDAIPLKQRINDTSHELHLIGVAEVHYWHGFDRLIQGLAEYYLQKQSYKVFFHIVGQLSGERERQEIIPAIYNNGLTPYVILHGARYGKELDELFEQADLGIGSLGRHRSGIDKIKVLKNREYAARGLAFTYSETDEDFDNMPYVWKVPANETSMDIQKLIEFHQSIHLQPIEIRNSIANLSWKHQMQEVINQISLMTTHNA